MAVNLGSTERRQNLLPSEVPDNKETIQLIWLDGKMNDSADYDLTQSMLLELNPAAQFYSDYDRCIDLIKTIKDEQIFLVVSGAFARRVLEQIHTHRTLVAIFIFCANRQHHEPLLKQYNKIVEIFTDQDSLLESIREKMNLIEKQTLAFSLFDQKQKGLKDLSKESASFLLHQMLIFVLKQMPQNEQTKKEMIDLCRDYYQKNKQELKKITEFERSYSREKAIEWYTDECFLYKLLNKALRTEDIDLLYTFRFFIIDLCAAIEDESHHLKDKDILKLYRGTQIPMDELQKLKENIDKIISTNGFLSTSRNINVSLGFTQLNPVMNGFVTVLFEIEADPSLKTVIFADIAHKGRIEGEEEVLFNLNSLFKIKSVHFDSTLDLWKVHLHATNEGSEKVEEYLKLSKQEMEEYSPIIYFGGLLRNELGQVNRAGKYFNMLLKSLPSDHSDIAAVYNNIGAVHYKRSEYNLALKNYEIGYEIRRKQLPHNHPNMASSLNNIGSVYEDKGNFDLALDYYQQTLTIDEINHPGDHSGKAMTIENIGGIYIKKGDFDTALTYLFRALEMYKRVLPEQSPNTATCLGEIGDVHEKKGDFDVALDYYHQQLKMDEQCLPFDHPDLSADIRSIVDTYKTMGEIEKGLQFCQEKLVVQKNRLGDRHPRTAQTLMVMADVIKDSDRNEALAYHNEALSILENSVPPDHHATSGCLTSMLCLYSDYNMNEDAVRCGLKALDIHRQIFSSDHINIANNLRNIGISYENMNNLVEALRYYNESLSIYRLNYGPEHEYVKRGEAEIATLNDVLSSPSFVESEQKSVEDETRFDPSPFSFQQIPSSVDCSPESQTNQTSANKPSTTVTSKTCAMQ